MTEPHRRNQLGYPLGRSLSWSCCPASAWQPRSVTTITETSRCSQYRARRNNSSGSCRSPFVPVFLILSVCTPAEQSWAERPSTTWRASNLAPNSREQTTDEKCVWPLSLKTTWVKPRKWCVKYTYVYSFKVSLVSKGNTKNSQIILKAGHGDTSVK